MLCISACQTDKKSTSTGDSPIVGSTEHSAILKKEEEVEIQWEESETKENLSTIDIHEDVEEEEEKKLEAKETTPKKKAPKKSKKNYAKIEFETLEHDFGTITEGDTIYYKFAFTNKGKIPLDITSAKGTCGCARPSFPFIAVDPGDSGFIGVQYISINKEGNEAPEITVTSNGSVQPITLVLKGYVEPRKASSDDEKEDPTVRIDSTLLDTLSNKGN